MPVISAQKEIERSQLYTDMFEHMNISKAVQSIVLAVAKRGVQYYDTYRKIENTLNIPWYAVAAIHYRESNYNFGTHLHNGDSLTKRTIHVPAGRPVKGAPPFNWYDSAVDALLYDNLENTDQFTIGELLLTLEKYNGMGYYTYHNMFSPYVWNDTQYYTAGKYASDGIFNSVLKDNQVGCAPLIAALIEIKNGWER